jgi:hypothetical protein
VRKEINVLFVVIVERHYLEPVRYAVACRRPHFCFDKSKQNQRSAKLGIHASNSCATASLQRQKQYSHSV